MASIRRHPVNNKWQVRYRDPDGKQRTRNFDRKVDANAFAEDVEADKRRGQYVDPHAGKITFDVYADRWIATRADKATQTINRDKSYLNSMILPTFKSRPVAAITTSEISQWVATLDRADTTRAKALQILSAVLEVARHDRAITVNPAVDVKRIRPEPDRIGKALTDAEVTAILDAAEHTDETTAGVVWLMARAGLRIGEALAIHWSDIDLDRGILQVRRSLTPTVDLVAVKGRKRADQGRTIPMPPDLTARLAQHQKLSSSRDIGGFMFTAPKGGPIRVGNWRRRVWYRIVEAAGVDCVPHDLRHTTATRLMLQDRWTPAEVQTYLGHSDPRVTLKIYTHITSDDLPTPSQMSM